MKNSNKTSKEFSTTKANGKIDQGVGPEGNHDIDNGHDRSNDYSNAESSIHFNHSKFSRHGEGVKKIKTRLNSPHFGFGDASFSLGSPRYADNNKFEKSIYAPKNTLNLLSNTNRNNNTQMFNRYELDVNDLDVEVKSKVWGRLRS
jgi:hypothetical protein